MLLRTHQPAHSRIAIEIQTGGKEAARGGDLLEEKCRCLKSIPWSDIGDGLFQWGQNPAAQKGYWISAILEWEYQ